MQNVSAETKKLSKYYVAYIDILGAKNFINSEQSEEYLNKIYELYNETLKFFKENTNRNFFLRSMQTKIFSDNIVIAIPQIEFFGDTENEINSCYILIFAMVFQILALSRSMLVRGSIVSDDFYIDDNFVYGKALTNAYELESKIANYPRIIINPSSIYEFMLSDLQENVIEQDNDNIFYLNPFVYYFTSFNWPNKKDLIKCMKESLEDILSNTPKKERYFPKVCWFINLFNDFCINYEYSDYVVDINNYPYPTKVEKIIYTGKARELV